jgi:fucose permease
MIEKRWIIIFGAFISMSFLGMSRTFLGTSLPSIRTTFGLTLVQAGTLTALLQFGFTLAVFVGGPLSDIFKRSFLLMAGCLLMGINLILFGFSDWFLISLLGMSFIGIGGGLIEASSNPLLIHLFPGRESMVMNLHHFFFAAGSLLGPLIMGTLLAREIPWQWVYIGFGIFVLIIFFLLSIQRISSPKVEQKFELKAMVKLVKEKKFLILLTVAFFGLGVQNGIGYWMVTFLRETKSFSISLASTSLFLFFTCLAMGRLFSSYIITKLNEDKYLLGLFSLLFVALFLSIFVPGQWSIMLFALCGLAHSGVFPCLLGMVGKLYSKNPGTAMGLLATGSGLGSMSVPWLMSFISQLSNLTIGFLSFEIYVMVCFFLMIFYMKITR